MTLRDKDDVVHIAIETAAFNGTQFLITMCTAMRQLLYKEGLEYFTLDKGRHEQVTCLGCLAI